MWLDLREAQVAVTRLRKGGLPDTWGQGEARLQTSHLLRVSGSSGCCPPSLTVEAAEPFSQDGDPLTDMLILKGPRVCGHDFALQREFSSSHSHRIIQSLTD